LPTIGTPKHQHAGEQNERRLHEADQHIGRDLAEHDLERRDRHGEQAFHGAALDLAGDRERGEDQHRQGENGAEQAGDDVERCQGRRIVAVMRADLEQRLGAFGKPAVVDERGGNDLRQRRHRRAGRDRVGGVGGDEQRRHVAAAQRALEARRNLHRKQHGARGEHLIEFVFVAQLARDLEEFGVAQGHARMERPTSLDSCSNTAVGRSRGIVLIA
jgi:hypothetical protein